MYDLFAHKVFCSINFRYKHIYIYAWSCRFALFNIKKIRPFLSEHASQLLVQALVLSRLDYCNAFLAGLPASSIKPLQLIQNAAARYIFNEPKRTHVTPLFINLHWLPIAARIKFKALMFAYRTTSGSAPLYLNSVLQTYVPLEACVLQVNDALLCHPKEAHNHFHGLINYRIDPNIRQCFFSWKYIWKNAVVLYSGSTLWHVNNTPTTIGGAKHA